MAATHSVVARSASTIAAKREEERREPIALVNRDRVDRDQERDKGAHTARGARPYAGAKQLATLAVLLGGQTQPRSPERAQPNGYVPAVVLTAADDAHAVRP